MPQVVVTASAARDLSDLIASHQLPPDTVARVRRAIAALERFPALGAELRRSLDGRRFLLGPWRWMIIVYRYDADLDRVAVLTIVDGRTSTSPTAHR